MIVTIKRRGLETAQVSIERLVSTLGFGKDCDVSLAEDRLDLKLGMLIQQGDGLSFRPLKSEHHFFLGDIVVDAMMPLGENEWLRVDEFELSWSLSTEEIKNDPTESKPLPPPPKPMAFPVMPNRAGAMMAYGQTSNTASPSNEESLELSDMAKAPVKEQKVPEPKSIPTEPMKVLEEEPVKVKESAPAIPEKRSPAEAELVEKLKRLQTVRKSPEVSKEVVKEEVTEEAWVETEEEVLGPAWKRAIKYFYHHIELEIFEKSVKKRKEYLSTAIQAALDATLGDADQEVVRHRVERELKSTSPFDKLSLALDIQVMRVTDKGLLAIDRGKGFGAPEMSFYNAGHVCWAFDQFLQSKEIEVKFYGAECQSLNLTNWMVNAYFPPIISDGFLIQMKRETKVLSTSLTWIEEAEATFLSLHRSRKNILVVAKESSDLKQIFQLMQTNLREGQILGVLGEKLKELEDESKFLFLDQEQSLAQILKVSQTLGLSGIADFDLEGRGKSVFQQAAFKDLGYWGYIQASKPIDALRRFELQWRLSSQQSDRQTIREWVQASFPFLINIQKDEDGSLDCVVSAVGFKDGRWVLKQLPDGDWE